MTKIVFISDFFVDEILGGAEKCNDALIKQLKKNYAVEKYKSSHITLKLLEENKDAFFIVANFFQLHQSLKTYLSEHLNYIIYEHDHKYLTTNNPTRFKDFMAPSSCLSNKMFFKCAKNVICQSRLHAEVLYKNLLISNIINAGANFWDEKDLEILQNFIDNKKTIKYAAFKTANQNKGMSTAINYCQAHQLDLTLIPQLNYEEFIGFLSTVENLVFFPQWIESYSRVAVEAKILGCSLITNKLLGVATEPYFKLKGAPLLKKLKENNTELIKKINKIISNQKVDANFDMKKIPKITICCSLYEGEKFIEGFLEDITSQTIFDDCELIIVNANSPQDEEKIIYKYMKKFNNIKYHRLDYRATTTEVTNMVINTLASGEYITFGNVDDRRRKDCLEEQARHLMFNEGAGLVYGDCYQTSKENETFVKNSSNQRLYQHSLNDFSPQNMIKCLPGPIPMWRRKLHDKVGVFSTEYKYSNDWEMWMRMVKSGIQFKKIDEVLGLYYFNEEGRSTAIPHFPEKIKEERQLFLENKEMFGSYNYNRYKDYFMQEKTNDS